MNAGVSHDKKCILGGRHYSIGRHVGQLALAAQDKYTVKVPNGLAFSEFRGYENWQDIAVSQTENGMMVIVANPARSRLSGTVFQVMASTSPTVPRLPRSSGLQKRMRNPRTS
jgi:hypothetical protein